MITIPLNNGWKYSETFLPEMTACAYKDDKWEDVRLPHTNKMLAYHYFDEQEYQFVSCYRKTIEAPKEWADKAVLLTFGAAAHVAKVYFNGVLITTHFGGYTAFTVDISSYLDYEKPNVLAVELDSRESQNLPPFGHTIDYLTYGGLYREVHLEIKNRVHIQDSFIKTTQVTQKEKNLTVELTLNTLVPDLHVEHRLYSLQNELLMQSGRIPVTQKNMRSAHGVLGVQNWELEHPQLYLLQSSLYQGEQCIDRKTVRFGFRECEFKADGFYLNHKKMKLVGLNRHQSYAYVGYAMPKRQQISDADILKKELGINCVRTSHYPQSQHFIDRCDELGLLVFTEIPGWQHIGDSAWQEIACRHTEEMVLQYRNHPSIILWGVRINESQDNDDFYTKTNQIAHALDDTRQTGGVRFIQKSNLLEDVYTYNDFVHNGTTHGLDEKQDVTSNMQAPYLVTEFNGHMFPTKRFDSEAHRLSHALRHARVLNAMFEKPEITGAIGWCMADYNTHQDFGSGDRICYHGVLDMFRIPKLAAAVYASQGRQEPVFSISSTMDIGDHPAGYLGDVVAFTNADSVRLYKGDELIQTFYPNRDGYGHLPHPPILIDDLVGDLIARNERFSPSVAQQIKAVLLAVAKYGQHTLPLRYKLQMAKLMLTQRLTIAEGVDLFTRYVSGWGGSMTRYRFEAVKGNQVISTITREPVKQARLCVEADTETLKEADTYDVARVVVKAVDQNGNLLPYYQESIRCETQGCIQIIGPTAVSLKGGAVGIYVRTTGQAGPASLHIHQEDVGRHRVDFMVTKREDEV